MTEVISLENRTLGHPGLAFENRATIHLNPPTLFRLALGLGSVLEAALLGELTRLGAHQQNVAVDERRLAAVTNASRSSVHMALIALCKRQLLAIEAGRPGRATQYRILVQPIERVLCDISDEHPLLTPFALRHEALAPEVAAALPDPFGPAGLFRLALGLGSVLEAAVLGEFFRRGAYHRALPLDRRKLARQANVSVSSVHGALQRLEAAGFLAVVRPGSGRRPTSYRLNPAAIVAALAITADDHPLLQPARVDLDCTPLPPTPEVADA